MYLYILVISFLPFPLWPFAFMGFGILAIAIEGILKRAVERGSLEENTSPTNAEGNRRIGFAAL